MKMHDTYKECKKHGHTLFKHKENTKGEWWVCHECLKEQWKKAQLKRRKKPEVRSYQRDFNREKASLYKSLTLILNLIILASFLKPE